MRKTWIDTTRGICMLAIVLNHTDIYLAGDPVIAFDLFGTNALMTFFIVSGYLFYRGTAFSLRRKVTAEFKHLVVPYFIFTTLIAVPKALVHGDALSGTTIITTILFGQASWFVAARVVAGLLFATLITLSLRYHRYLLALSCVIAAAVPFVCHSPWLSLWNSDIALMSLVYLCIGYYFHAYEEVVSRYMRWTIVVPVLVVVVVIKVIEQRYGIAVPVSPQRMTAFPVFLIDTLLGAFVIIAVCRQCCHNSGINFIGRNSLVYYFLCGGVPLLTGIAFRHVGLTYHGNYLVVLLDFAVVIAVMSALAYVILRHLPWMLGRSNSHTKQPR